MSVRVWSMCPFRCGREEGGLGMELKVIICVRIFFFRRVEGLFPRLIVAVSA